MSILLGNLKLEDIVEEKHLEKIKTFLDNNGFQREEVCNNIEKKSGNYHIFDIPRQMVICDERKMQEFVKFLKDNNLVGTGFKERIGLIYSPPTNPPTPSSAGL